MYTEHVHCSRFQHAIHLSSHFPFRAPRVRTAGVDDGFQSCLDGLKKKYYSLRESFHRQHVQTGSTGASKDFGGLLTFATVDGQTVELAVHCQHRFVCLKK